MESSVSNLQFDHKGKLTMWQIPLRLIDKVKTDPNFTQNEIKHLCKHCFGVNCKKILLFFDKEWKFFNYEGGNLDLKYFHQFEKFYLWDGYEIIFVP